MNIADIWKFDLCWGSSPDPEHRACLLDAVSWMEYGRLGDHPDCVCPVIAAYGRILNDMLPDDRRQELKRFIPRLAGTVDRGAERARAEYLAWQAIRVFAPIALRAVGLDDAAGRLAACRGSLIDAAKAAELAASAAWRAVSAAENAASAAGVAAGAESAASAAGAAGNADVSRALYDAAISALEGVLAIGRQAEAIPPACMAEAARLFAAARV